MAGKKTVLLPYPVSVEEELKKNPEIKPADVVALKEWCDKQQHLPKLLDLLILMFLHCNNGNLESAKRMTENFFTIRSHIPEFFSGRDPLGSKELRKALNTVICTQLPTPSKHGYDIIVVSVVDPDPSHYSFETATKQLLMTMDLIGLKNGLRDGYITVIDAANVSLGHVGRLSPMGLKKLILYVQDALPIRLKSVHFINTHPILDMVLGMMKPFAKHEFWSKIQVHPTLKTLEEHISVDALPDEFGGKAGPLSKFNEARIIELDDKREWFIQEEELGRVNESLRVGKSVNADQLFGAEGTFKKLDID